MRTAPPAPLQKRKGIRAPRTDTGSAQWIRVTSAMDKCHDSSMPGKAFSELHGSMALQSAAGWVYGGAGGRLPDQPDQPDQPRLPALWAYRRGHPPTARLAVCLSRMPSAPSCGPDGRQECRAANVACPARLGAHGRLVGAPRWVARGRQRRAAATLRRGAVESRHKPPACAGGI